MQVCLWYLQDQVGQLEGLKIALDKDIEALKDGTITDIDIKWISLLYEYNLRSF